MKVSYREAPSLNTDTTTMGIPNFGTITGRVFKMLKPAYCDRIAHAIREELVKSDPLGIIGLVGPIEMDLNSEGSFMSTKKTLEVTDMNGKTYSVTIEEK